MNRGDEQRNWMWLDEPFTEYRNDIVDKVTALYEDPGNRPLRFYTTHELGHCQAVEDLLHRLLPGGTHEPLTMEERFYLLASAWLHDIGMLSTVADRVWKAEARGRAFSDDEIRRRHHQTTARFILDCPFQCGVKEVDRHILATLCRLHRRREDLWAVPERPVFRGRRVRLRLLGAYLRLADALHIDLTRAPDRDFTYCLAWDIPPDTLLHWIKSRLVSGVFPDHRSHRIEVQFQQPSEADALAAGRQLAEVRKKLDIVIRHVLDDLREELASVMPVLIEGGFTYYLDVKQVDASGMDQATMNHLFTLAMDYDAFARPSASGRLALVLVDLAENAGYRLRLGEAPEPLPPAEGGDVRGRLQRFLGLLEGEFRTSRHLGIVALVERCREALGKEPFELDAFVKVLDDRFQRHHRFRKDIRREAERAGIDPPAEREAGLLLYGYSELVIQALCGLRDRLLRGINGDPGLLRGCAAELQASRRFRIFVCDGQPKAQAALGDRLVYHDGLAYVHALRKRNFTNLVLIPDIAAGAVTAHHPIDLLLVGANGFSDTVFHHSAGHASMIRLLSAREDVAGEGTKVVLVVSSDKYRSSGAAPPKAPPPTDQAWRQVDGYAFWTGAGEASRDNVWFCRDMRVRRDLEEQQGHVQLFNPREDDIPIAAVDQVISDVGAFPIRAAERSETEANIRTFLEAVRTARDRATARP